MSVPNRQIGWSNESNLLWQLSKQLDTLTNVTSTNLNAIIANLATKVTNQLGTPSFRSDTLANLPAAGQTGRMFISTDTFAFYRDNGTGWDLIGGPGIGTVTGSGTTNYLSKWTGSSALGNSLVFDNGTSIGISTASPNANSNLTLQQSSTTTGGIFITTSNQPLYGGVIRNINNTTTQNELLIGTTQQPASGSRGLVVRGFNSGVVELYGRNVDNATQIDVAIGTLFNPSIRAFAATKNVSIKSDVDAGYALDVNGTFRAQSINTALSGSIQYVNFASANALFNTSSSSYTFSFWNGSGSFTIASDRVSTLRRFDFLGQSTDPVAGLYGTYFNTTDNQLKTYTSAGWKFIPFEDSNHNYITSGGGYFGNSTTDASAILSATSTTKGFLPPRMTGAQAEAIGTPAAGLMVYSTDGSGATITSLGWWGFNGTTWVKLN